MVMSRQLSALKLWNQARQDKVDDARVEAGKAAARVSQEQDRMSQLQQFRASCNPKEGLQVDGLSLQTNNLFAAQMDKVIGWQQQQLKHHENHYKKQQQQVVRYQREAKQSDALLEKKQRNIQTAAHRQEQRQADELAQLMFQARARDNDELPEVS